MISFSHRQYKQLQNKHKHLVQFLGFLLLLSLSPLLMAESLTQLVNQGKITADIQQLNPSHVVARQAIKFEVIIKSPIELSEETVIDYQTIAGAITIHSEYGIETEQVDNQFVHAIAYNVFPLSPGTLIQPGLRIKLVHENAVTNKKEQADIFTGEIRADVELPQPLSNDDHYVVTANLTVSDDIDIPEDGRIELGGAIERSIYLIAQEVPAVLLPELTLTSPAGIKLYQKSPEVSEVYKVRLGVNETHKELKATYIFEEEGVYSLPAMGFVWWNVDSNEREVINLSAHNITVGQATAVAAPVSNESASIAERLKKLPWLTIMYVTVVLTFIAAIGTQVRKHRDALKNLYHQLNNTAEKRLRKQFLSSVEQCEYRQAINYLFEASRLANKTDLRLALQEQPELQKHFDQLMQLGFASEANSSTTISHNQAIGLFEGVIEQHKDRTLIKKFQFSMDLNK